MSRHLGWNLSFGARRSDHPVRCDRPPVRRISLRFAASLLIQIGVTLGWFLLAIGVSEGAFAAITYKQSNWNTQIPPQSVIRVWLPSVQTAGNLNVVVVGWADPAVSISSVTDLKGNTYSLAVGPTTSAGNARQSIYYAKTIVAAAAGTNAVTVTFSAPALYPDVRVAEYTGIDTTNPLDGATGATGSGSSLNSGSIATTNANDLLVTGNYIESGTASVDSGFTERMRTDEDQFLADKVVTTAGSYNATSTQSGCCYWIQQIAAFKKSAAGTIGYVQSDYVSQLSPPPSNTITTTYLLAQTAGSLNVLVISWGDDTATVTSVSDTKGNVYTRVVGPTTQAGHATQSIYYAKNIVAAAAGANQVTVTFSAPVRYPDLRIAEYAGVDTVNPFDGGVGASGTGTALNSGSFTTTNANDLLVAGNFVEQVTDSVGSGFTLREQTDEEDIIADKIVTTAGSYSATATQDVSGYWVMQVAAFKAAGGDTQPPTVPSNLSGSAVSASQINLNWTASTDNVGVTGYEVQRCLTSSCTFATVGTPVTNSFNNTGLAASTQYRYQVRARDAAGNWSAYSTPLNVTTLEGQPPSTPGNPAPTIISGTQVNFTWTASSDNVGVTAYSLERCTGATCTNFLEIAAPTTNAFNNTGLTGSTTYRYKVRARDAAGNWSNYSGIVNVTTPEGQAPSQPTNLTPSVISSTQINLTWTASTDNVQVTGYDVLRCQGTGCTPTSIVGTPTAASFNNTGLTANTLYRYQVRAKDAAGNVSTPSAIVNATTSGGDTQPPSVPTGVTAKVKLSTRVDLTWNPSTDNFGVTGYQVERCQGTNCTTFTPAATSYSDIGLSPQTSYAYRVRARDAAGNWSNYSGVVNATTVSQSETIAYTYDAKGRLVRVIRNGSVNNNVQTDYSYDRANNRKSAVTSGASQ